MSFSNIMDSNSYSPDHPVDPVTGSMIAARDRMLGDDYEALCRCPSESAVEVSHEGPGS